MKKLMLLSLLAILQSCFIGAGENSKIDAGKNNYFPKVTGIDLNGKKQEIPTIFKNKFNLVIIAFKREQQIEVDSWIKAVEPILKENTNLSFYEIPLIYELSVFKRIFLNNGMRFGITDEVARKRTITVYTNRQEFFKITQMKEEQIYALLIDDNGKIIWREEGIADDKKISDLNKIVQ
jgi:hypothetical protein